MSKRRIMKSVKALFLCGVMAVSSIAFTGCDVDATKKKTTSSYTQFNMECCGNAKLYGYKPTIKSCGAKKMSLSSCGYFTCSSSIGRYSIFSNGKGINIWTVNSKGKKSNEHTGGISGNTITIVL